eukprot:g7096.t1
MAPIRLTSSPSQFGSSQNVVAVSSEIPLLFAAGRYRPESKLHRILCYGDSLTAGFYQGGHWFQPYGRILADELAAYGGRCEILVCGLSGRSAEDMAAGINSTLAIVAFLAASQPSEERLGWRCTPELDSFTKLLPYIICAFNAIDRDCDEIDSKWGFIDLKSVEASLPALCVRGLAGPHGLVSVMEHIKHIHFQAGVRSMALHDYVVAAMKVFMELHMRIGSESLDPELGRCSISVVGGNHSGFGKSGDLVLEMCYFTSVRMADIAAAAPFRHCNTVRKVFEIGEPPSRAGCLRDYMAWSSKLPMDCSADCCLYFKDKTAYSSGNPTANILMGIYTFDFGSEVASHVRPAMFGLFESHTNDENTGDELEDETRGAVPQEDPIVAL